MKKCFFPLLIAVLLVSLLPQTALACPAYPGTVEVVDDSGNTVKTRLHGDEFFSYVTDDSGRLLYSGGDNDYYYVCEAQNEYYIGGAVSESNGTDPAIVVVSADTDTALLKEKLTALEAVLSSMQLMELNDEIPPLPDDYNSNNNDNDPLKGKRAFLDLNSITAPEKADTCPLLVLKVDFQDVKCQFSDTQWSERVFGNGNSVAKYYSEVSNGKFTYAPADETSGEPNDGVITVTLPISRPYFADFGDSEQNFGRGAQTGLYPALDGSSNTYAIYNDSSFFSYGLLLAESNINFAQYDRNGDGYISPTELAVIVVAAGYEASFGGTPARKTMSWAHSWYANNLYYNSSGETGDYVSISVGTKKIYKYTLVGENLNWGYDYFSGAQEALPEQSNIGTLCHELGHDLGLRDLYDTSYSPQEREVQALSLMASGGWGFYGGGKPGSSPTHLDPHSKLYLGFYDANVISSSGTYSVTEAANSSSYNILRINTDDPDIYYLVENRTFASFDCGMDYLFYSPGGVVVWRINEKIVQANWASNRINTESGNYGIMPVYVFYYQDEYGIYSCPYWSKEWCTESGKNEIAFSQAPATVFSDFAPSAPQMTFHLSIASPPPPPPPPQPEVKGGIALRSGFSASDGDIWMTDGNTGATGSLITNELNYGETYSSMLQLAGGAQVYKIYDIKLSGGKATGSPMYLNFRVPQEAAGSVFTLVHKKDDGSVERFTALTNANGELQFGPVYEFSPFMLVKGELTLPAATAYASAPVNVPKADILPPQTGDASAGAQYLLLAVMLAAFALMISKYKKHHTWR